jgi:16S rRNA (cytosine967-C5)-methyltransferase
MRELVIIAARLVAEANQGGRASAGIGRVLEARRASAAEAEQLSRLVYGALRRERRIAAVLSELRAPHSDIAVVLGAALLEAASSVDEAKSLVGAVPWAQFEAADRALLERVQGVERVALLGSLPDWLAARLGDEHADAAELAASLSEPPPRALRVNALVSDVEGARAALVAEGAQVESGRIARRALTLQGAFNPFVTRAFHEGLFELQDEGSQIVCELVAPPPRGLVVDACAGAGGKSLAVAALLEGRGKVLSLDVDEAKLGELRRRAKRARAANIQALAIAEDGALPEAVQAVAGRVDRLLIDAPCSGTGVLRRNPEARARLTPEAVERLAQTQRVIIERMLPLLAPGGRLVFATCSLLRAEGETLFDAVEAAHPELTPVNLAEIYDRAYIDRFTRSAPHRARLLPHQHGCDGFFVPQLETLAVWYWFQPSAIISAHVALGDALGVPGTRGAGGLWQQHAESGQVDG